MTSVELFFSSSESEEEEILNNVAQQSSSYHPSDCEETLNNVEQPSYFRPSGGENEYDKKVEAARRRRTIRDSLNPLELEDTIFQKNFGLSKAAFSYLLSEIQDKFRVGTRSTSISPAIKLAATLHYLAQGSYQQGVGSESLIGLAQPTVSMAMKEVLTMLEEHICNKWICANYTLEERNQAKTSFYQQSGIPGIIGCIDNTHIPITALKKELQDLYQNRNGFYSINAMIVCDHEMKIRYLNARYPGSTRDSMVFQKSTFKQKMEEDQQNAQRYTWFIGNASYPLKPYLLTPYQNPVEDGEKTYNCRHAEALSVIKRTINILKSRFRCLLRARPLCYTPEKCTQIINVCGALHNICISYNVEPPDLIDEFEEHDTAEENDTDEELMDHSAAAELTRNNITRFLD